MRGALSSTPAPSAVRLLVGSQLLLLIQVGLVLASRPPLNPSLSMIVLTFGLVGLAALICAIRGEPASDTLIQRPRHGR